MAWRPLEVMIPGLLTLVAMLPAAAETTPASRVQFGIDSASAILLSHESLRPTYGSLWVGPWNLVHGWRDTDARLDQLKEAGVTPYVQFYYWGDEIDPTCIEQGCWSRIHGVNKTQAGWDRLGYELIQHLNARLAGDPVVIVLETEFNKEQVASYEPLDELLSQKASILRTGYPAATIVLGFGNWGNWGTFDRAAAASDAVGLQAMRASTRHTPTQYADIVKDTLGAVHNLRTTFQKPVHLTDVALSSYPDQEGAQNETLGRLLGALPELEADGVEVIIYRDLFDQPLMDTSNYFGSAERHWGLRTHEGRDKPAFTTWRSAAFGTPPSGLPAAGPPNSPPANPPTPTLRAMPPRTVHAIPPLSGLPTPPPQSHLVAYAEAEAFLDRRGGTHVHDAAASGGAFWSLPAGGTIIHEFHVPRGGGYEIRVRAETVPTNDSAPRIALVNNESTLMESDPGAGWTNYGVRIHVDGPGTILLEVHSTGPTMGAAVNVDAVSIRATPEGTSPI